MKLTLYTAPASRGFVCEWLLEELELPHDKVIVDLAAGEHKRPDYLRIHPLGAVPALVVDELAIIETLAISLFLAENDSHRRLAALPTGALRAKWMQWMVYTVLTLESALVPPFTRAMGMKPGTRRDAATAQEQETFRALLAPLDVQLRRGTIMEEGFGVVDVCLACRLLWAEGVGLLPDPSSPAKSYLGTHLQRPAYVQVRKNQHRS